MWQLELSYTHKGRAFEKCSADLQVMSYSHQVLCELGWRANLLSFVEVDGRARHVSFVELDGRACQVSFVELDRRACKVSFVEVMGGL